MLQCLLGMKREVELRSISAPIPCNVELSADNFNRQLLTSTLSFMLKIALQEHLSLWDGLITEVVPLLICIMLHLNTFRGSIRLNHASSQESRCANATQRQWPISQNALETNPGSTQHGQLCKITERRVCLYLVMCYRAFAWNL